MSGETRRVRARALAKINLDLRVIGKRPDSYHELRTIFQTISLPDEIDIAFTPRRATRMELAGNLAIPDNLVLRAAELLLDAARVTGWFRFRLHKQIPMGAGLGGGSSDAAAILLALPPLMGRAVPLPDLIRIASQLGSDVPFFLLGGRAAGIGRGTELFPLPDLKSMSGVLIAPDVHVSTADAYRALCLTTELQQNKIVSFQSKLWDENGDDSVNDFEQAVFEQHPQLARWKKRLLKLGADSAMMTGSGSAVFGLFRTRDEVSRALKSIGDVRAFPFTLVSRSSYRKMWWRRLQAHIEGRLWPPRSRYAR